MGVRASSLPWRQPPSLQPCCPRVGRVVACVCAGGGASVREAPATLSAASALLPWHLCSLAPCRWPTHPPTPPTRPPTHPPTHPGMMSGALLARFCPDTGQCVNGASSGPTRRLLRAVLMLRGGDGAAGEAAAAGAGVGDPSGAPSDCNGRLLWLVVGVITLTSPVLVLLTQVCECGWGRGVHACTALMTGRHGNTTGGPDPRPPTPLACWCSAGSAPALLTLRGWPRRARRPGMHALVVGRVSSRS